MFEYAEETLRQFGGLLRTGSPQGQQLIAVVAPGRDNDMLAVDQAQNVYVLLANEGTGRALRSRKFSSISTLSSQGFRLEVAGVQVEKNYAALILNAGRRDLVSAFAVLTTALFAQMPVQPSAAQIDEFLDTFVELFQDGRAPNPAVVKGVWGELWFLSQSSDASTALMAWHNSRSEHFDFSANQHHVEVKTHEGERASHHFSHAQLSIAPEVTLLVSCLIYNDNAGQSIADLLDEIAARLDPLLRAELLRKTFDSLGSTIEDVAEYRFSTRNDASKSVLPAVEMPNVTTDDRAPVTNISYVVDITDLLIEHGLPLEAAFASLR